MDISPIKIKMGTRIETGALIRASYPQMPHLQQCNCSPPLVLSYSSIHKQERSIFLSGLRVFEVNELVELKIKRRNGSFGAVAAVEKDSEFEVDPDMAREALRKLDEQLLSLSKKHVDPPKIRAVDLKQANPRLMEETPELLSGSFLASIATVLIVFTIFYNVLFLIVIKPSIDGEKSVFATSNIEADEETKLQQLSSSPEIPVVP